jgi:hypothetical protein
MAGDGCVWGSCGLRLKGDCDAWAHDADADQSDIDGADSPITCQPGSTQYSKANAHGDEWDVDPDRHPYL